MCSPALTTVNMVQSAIRSYQKRRAGSKPSRKPFIEQHTLAGYALESALLPGLHPLASTDGIRRKGLVFYLEGSLGNQSWTNPFLGIAERKEDVHVALKLGEESRAKKISTNVRLKQERLDASAQGLASGPSRVRRERTGDRERRPGKGRRRRVGEEAEVVMGLVEGEEVVNKVEVEEPVRTKPVMIRLRIGSLYATKAPLKTMTQPSSDIQMLSLQDDSQDFSSTLDDDSEEEESDEGSELESAEGDYEMVEGDDREEEMDEDWNMDQDPFDTDTTNLASVYMERFHQRDDSDMSDDEEILAAAPRGPAGGSISAFAQSFFTASPKPLVKTVPPPVESPSDGQVLADALFPTHALDTSFPVDGFVPALVPDIPNQDSSSSEEDEVGTEYMDYIDDEYEPKAVAFDTMNYRDIFSPKEEDVEGSEVDTPATTPRAYSDHDMDDANPVVDIACVDPAVEEVNADLQAAVQVLGRLLPDFSDSLGSLDGAEIEPDHKSQSIPDLQVVAENTSAVPLPTHNQGANPTQQTRARRKSSVGQRDFLRLSLPIPVCPVPSPLNSPSLDQGSMPTDGDNLVCPSPGRFVARISPSPSFGRGMDASDLELLPDLQDQTPVAEPEPACVCKVEADDIEGGSTPRKAIRSGFPFGMMRQHNSDAEPHAGGTEDPFSAAPAALLGPESVGVDELDKVWGIVNAAAVMASAEKAKRKRREIDNHSVSSNKSDVSSGSHRQMKDTWGHIGVGGGDTSGKGRKLEKVRFARALISRAKTLGSVQLPKLACGQSSPCKLLKALPDVSEDDAIGMEEVADAVLAAWANGETDFEGDGSMQYDQECEDDSEEGELSGYDIISPHHSPSPGVNPFALKAKPSRLPVGYSATLARRSAAADGDMEDDEDDTDRETDEEDNTSAVGVIVPSSGSRAIDMPVQTQREEFVSSFSFSPTEHIPFNKLALNAMDGVAFGRLPDHIVS